MSRRLWPCLLTVLLAACGTPPPGPGQPPQALPDFPYQAYLAVPGAAVYEVDNDRTRVAILVRRGGTLARFGHDHVVSARPSEGFILLSGGDFSAARADIRFALDALVVDDPLLREQFALDTQPTPQDIEGTAANMHGKVLQTAAWPQAHIGVAITGGAPPELQAQLTLYLHGEKQAFPVTCTVAGLGQKRLQVSATFEMRQSDYGIAPFSVLGGGLQVLDQLQVSFTLEATQLPTN